MAEKTLFKEGTGAVVAGGALSVLETILYVIFKSPFALWRMSCAHLKEMREQAKLDIEKIDKPLPFILFLVRLVFDFLLHAAIFLTVVIAPIAAIYVTIVGMDAECYKGWMFFRDLFGTFAVFYYATWAIRLVIELLKVVVKYAPVILGIIFYPFAVICNFFKYLMKKAAYKAEKYEKKLAEK